MQIKIWEIGRWLLLPFSVIYGTVTAVRNQLFDVNILKNYQPTIFTVNIGNLQVGGTGKTPHVEYLIDFFKNEKVAVLSRGYGRKTKGLLTATPTVKPADIGDEPFQLYRRFGPSGTKVVVDANRVEGAKYVEENTDAAVLLLDDAYQHRYIKPQLNLLLTPFQSPFTRDFIMPTGRMRESRRGAERADAVIVSKSPSGYIEEKADMMQEIRRYTSENTPVFFSEIRYGTVTGMGEAAFSPEQGVVVFCGLGQPETFLAYCQANFRVQGQKIFPDHYDYQAADIEKLLADYPESQFITTEKDFVKVNELLNDSQKSRFFYLPMQVTFEDEPAFRTFLSEAFDTFN